MKPQWSTPSGNLGYVIENTVGAFYLAFNMVPFGSIEIISGNIPDGMVFNGLNGSITGTATPVVETTACEFTIRLKNADGISDRTFSIIVTNESPIWVTPSVIVEHVPPDQNYRNRQVIDYDLQVVDIGSSNIKYELVGGSLPDGVSLREDGKITGYIKDIGKVYQFTARAYASEIVEKTFTLVIVDDGQNRPPYWSTLPGWLGDIREGVYFGFNLTGDDSDSDPLNFTLVSPDTLPSGLSLSNTGWLSGTLNTNLVEKKIFRVEISDGNRTVVREFFLRCNYTLDQDDIFIIPPINSNDPMLLGSIEQDEDSHFSIQAVNTSEWDSLS